MQMTKKVVSIVLAVMMVVSMMVVGAVSVSAMTDSDLDAALAAGGTVTLDSDVDYGSSYAYIPAGKTVTLDLNGYKITSTSFALVNDGTLTIKDSSNPSTGLIKGRYAIRGTSGSKTTINSGNFESTEATVSTGSSDTGATITIKGGTFTSHDNAPLMGNGSATAGNNKWTISGGTFNGEMTSVSRASNYTACAIYAPNNDTWTISGGTFNVTDGVGIVQRAGTVKVTGGTFNVTGDGTTGKVGDSRIVVPSGTAIVYDSKAEYPNLTDSSQTTVTGGTFTAPTPVAQVKNDGDATRVTVSGGSFDNAVNETYIDQLYEYDTTAGKIVAKDDLTAEWEWVDSTAASYRYQAQLTLKDGNTVVYTKLYNPTIVVVNDDFNYTCAAQKVANISYGPIADKLVEANGEIKTLGEFNKAVNAGGEWTLGNDINGVTSLTVPDGFKLDGNNHTITTNGSMLPSYYMFRSKTATTKFELSNVTLDGANSRYGAVEAYTGNSGNNPENVITLNNVTIQNFNNKSTYTGAVYAFGSSTVNLNNCTITGNKVKATTDAQKANTGAAVWAGAKATVNINGGTYDEILLHGGTANATVDGGATVDTVRFGFTNSTEDSSKMKATINDATVNSLENYTEFFEENVVKDPTLANVAAPEGYMWDNSATTGMKTLVPEHPLNPLMKAADAINDGNKFGLTGVKYLKGTLLGVQKKGEIAGADKTSENEEQETGKDIRFVAVLDTSILQGAEDYGFVLAKVNASKTYSDTKFDNLKAYFGNGEKTVSAKNTYNNVCSSNEAYGDPTDNTTDYKYITCAVNGLTNDDTQVVARFFVKKDGKTYYAKYTGNNYHFTGCMVPYSFVA